ncbi:uncharacterized protein BO97DRAFT_425085 [Aspergillus homomorphus CBS 101889]|uniref:Uncharacterized protein n=1 Tax=Aspergillus homomorphus (strain CBS 101889) TaxID=1450537 RepID=A0A395HW87_ASPHC|nr:hypothetical protein BO97DRAFT_425085 [Aspergillus homomorphus CBS 101889]RAL11786.1 hypothetical protein BO97DRAFT_425085 [Aspergillus homomorphus CBS 101889]
MERPRRAGPAQESANPGLARPRDCRLNEEERESISQRTARRPGLQVKIEEHWSDRATCQTETSLQRVREQQIEHRPRWLTSMDNLVEFIQNFRLPIALEEDVRMLLIDDGVDIEEKPLPGKINGGRGFCAQDHTQSLERIFLCRANAVDTRNLEAAIGEAAMAGISMFCAANDQGAVLDIGDAEASRAVWKWMGAAAAVDFIFPGPNVVKERLKDGPVDKGQTLIALQTQAVSQSSKPGDHLDGLEIQERMRENVFEEAAEISQGKTPGQFPAIVQEVANKLKTRKLL